MYQTETKWILYLDVGGGSGMAFILLEGEQKLFEEIRIAATILYIQHCDTLLLINVGRRWLVAKIVE